MYLNYPETYLPPPVHGKIVFHEISPWCKKTGDRDDFPTPSWKMKLLYLWLQPVTLVRQQLIAEWV